MSSLLPACGKREVTDCYGPIISDKYIVWFQVAMKDAQIVHCLQYVKDLKEDELRQISHSAEQVTLRECFQAASGSKLRAYIEYIARNVFFRRDETKNVSMSSFHSAVTNCFVLDGDSIPA